MDPAEQLERLSKDPNALLAFIEKHHPELLAEEDESEEGSDGLGVAEFEIWNRATRRSVARHERRRRQGPKR